MVSSEVDCLVGGWMVRTPLSLNVSHRPPRRGRVATFSVFAKKVGDVLLPLLNSLLQKSWFEGSKLKSFRDTNVKIVGGLTHREVYPNIEVLLGNKGVTQAYPGRRFQPGQPEVPKLLGYVA